MKFKIREITTTNLVVDYDDGSWAEVPIRKGMSKDNIYDVVKTFNEKVVVFDKVEDVPVTKDDKWHEIEIDDDRLLTYQEARQQCFPNNWEHLYADYLGRKGDNSHQTKIDERIAAVLAKFPKDDTKYTAKEVRDFEVT